MSFFKYTFRSIIDILFPPHHTVRDATRVSITSLEALYVLSQHENRAYTALPYTNPVVRSVVKANKYHRDQHAATLLGHIFALMLNDIHEEHALAPEWQRPLLVPVPSSKERRRTRGYNQVERIVRFAPEEIRDQFAYDSRVLERHHRESQARIEKNRRHANMKDVFFVRESNYGAINDHYVILIDDVVESGATFSDATRALREAGARDVLCVALAK